jgi:ribonuclease P protein component
LHERDLRDLREVSDQRKGGAVYNFENALASTLEALRWISKNLGKNSEKSTFRLSANLLTAQESVRNLAASFSDPFCFQQLIVLFVVRISVRRMAMRAHHEAHLSAEQDPSQTNSRISRAHGKQRRSPGSVASPRQGPQASDSLVSCLANGATIRRLPFRPRQRIRSTAEFDTVYKTGRRAGDSYFGVVFRANQAGAARLGMSVSVRSIGSAVSRNRLRRLIRESFRHQQHALPHIDIVITARPAARGAAPEELRTSLNTHWLNLIRKCAASS